MCYLILISFIHNNIIAWNLSGLAIVILYLNRSTADSNSFSSVWRRSFKLFEVTEMVLSSAKFCKSDSASHKNKSFIKILNRIGPITGPCGTPESVTLKQLDILLIFKLCFWGFKKLWRNFSVSNSRPYVCSLPISRSWGINWWRGYYLMHVSNFQ